MTFTTALSSIAIIAGSLLQPAAMESQNDTSGESRLKEAAFEIIQNRIYTSAEIAGLGEHTFLLDNGWSFTTIDADLIAGEHFTADGEISFNAVGKKGNRELIGTVEALTIGELRIPSARVRSSEVIDRLKRAFKKDIAGVIGCQPLHQQLTTFSFSSSRIIFEPFSGAARDRLQKQEGVIALPFGPHPFSPTSTHLFSIPLDIHGNRVHAIIDFGFQGGILTNLPPSSLGVSAVRHRRKASFPVRVGGYSGSGQRSQVDVVRIGSFVDQNVPFICFDADEAPVFALLGIDYLKQFDITFDYQDRMMYLQPGD